MKLTSKELEVMAVLWDSKTPLTATELTEISANRTWKVNSIYTILNTLVKKGAVELTDYKPTGTINARAYKPIITPAEYALISIKDIQEFGESGIDIDMDVLLKGIMEMKEG